jgi:DNA invertase Pin-like site-specific DNA recombinase
MSTAALVRPLAHHKIHGSHYERLAAVYVRQSTPQQMLRHQESTRLQYGLVERALALGWAKPQVLVIDEDLGKSADSVTGRSGFQRLVAEVSLAHVGIIFGLEMSRLARSNRDWHHLLEVCALFGTLIGDLDGIYDPTDYNDRLLLGLKGAMSEAELHVLKQRMMAGKRAKAERGALGMPVPMGRVPIFPVRLRAELGVKWPYVSTDSTAPPCSTSVRAIWPRHWHDTRKCLALSSAG